MAMMEQLLSLQVTDELRAGRSEMLDSHIRTQIIPAIQNISSKTELSGGQATKSDPLAALDPFQHTLPYFYILNHQIASASQKTKAEVSPQLMPGGDLWNKIERFVNGFDPVQIRYVGPDWKAFTDVLCGMSELGRSGKTSATSMLASSMIRLDPTGGTFTSTHVDLVKCALGSRAYADAVPVLNLDIYSLPSTRDTSNTPLCGEHHLSNSFITVESGLTSKPRLDDVLEYYSLGAMVYIALQDWERAKYFLEHVLSTPTHNNANASMTAAYRKWVLVGLLKDGKTPSVPRIASAGAIRTIKTSSKMYDAIASAFDAGDSQKLQAEIEEASTTIQEDGNAGLVKDVVNHHRRLLVMKLSKVYTAVPVARIVKDFSTSPEEMSTYLQTLIEEKYLQAEISRGAQEVLRFHQTSEQADGKLDRTTRARLEERELRIRNLALHVEEVERQLSLTKEYLEFSRMERGTNRGKGASDEPIPMSFMPQGFEDENMMND